MLGLLKTNALVPGGANGVLSKLNSPSSIAYAESFLFVRARRSKFKVIFECGLSSHHISSGNCGCAVQRPEMK